MTEEQRLIEKLRRIEALFSGATSPGERAAAEQAARRVRDRLDAARASELIEIRFSLPDEWARALLIALLRRHGVRPYRYSGQRRNTVMARVAKDLVDAKIWPEFQELHRTLHEYLGEVTRRVIASAIHGDVSEPEIRAKPGQLAPGSTIDFE